VCAQRNARGGKAVQRCAARRRWGPIRRGGCGTTGAEGAARLGKETSEGWVGYERWRPIPGGGEGRPGGPPGRGGIFERRIPMGRQGEKRAVAAGQMG